MRRRWGAGAGVDERRAERLKAALRENLRRRKARPAKPPRDDAASEPETDGPGKRS